MGNVSNITVRVSFYRNPQGRVWAQEFLHFFIRTDSDTLPLQSWQLTSQPTLAPGTTATPDPANIFFEAKLNVIQVEEQYGIDLKEPTWLPENFVIVGATFDPTHSVGRIFYSGGDYDDLVLKEEIYSSPDTCDLCDKVGESASVKYVSDWEREGRICARGMKFNQFRPHMGK